LHAQVATRHPTGILVANTVLDTEETVRPSGRRSKASIDRFGYQALAPTLVAVTIVVIVPLAYSLYLSLNLINPITRRWRLVGLENYAGLITDSTFWASFGRTAYFSAFTVIGTTVLGVIFAVVLNERFNGRGLLRSIMLVPWAMAPVAVGVLWSFFYAGSFGMLNGLLNDLGLSQLASAWLGGDFRALNLVALTQVWNQTPLTALLVLAALQSIPKSLYSAALLDGAGPIRRFTSITLPALKSTLLFAIIVATINALMAFDIILIMTNGGPGAATTTLSWLGYMRSFQFHHFGEGAAVLYVLTFLSLALAIIFKFVLAPRRSRNRALPPDRTWQAGGARQHQMVDLPVYRPRSWMSARTSRWLTVGLHRLAATLILLWSALPVLALLLMSLSPAADLIRTPPTVLPSHLTFQNFISVLTAKNGLESVQAERVPLALLNSLVVGIAVTAFSVFLGVFSGYAFARYGHRRFFAGALWGLLLTRMVPALTLILPMFILFRTMHLLDTRIGLVIAYSSILLPLCAWMLRATFESVPRSLDRAALIDGCSHLSMMWKVVLPVARPGIVAAAIFSFLVSWNEFLFALILTSTPNSQTIPVIIAGFLVQAQFYAFGPLFAATVLTIVPPVIITFAFQRYLVQGALSGAIKG
jgi:multiple sugar transport system permease protein